MALLINHYCHYDPLMEALRAATASYADFPPRIRVRIGPRIEFVEVSSIRWIEAADQYANLHVDQKSFLLRTSMATLEERLNPGKFFRVHRCAIVNLEFVRELLMQDHGECLAVLSDATKVRVSRFRKNRFLEALERLVPVRADGRDSS